MTIHRFTENYETDSISVMDIKEDINGLLQSQSRSMMAQTAIGKFSKRRVWPQLPKKKSKSETFINILAERERCHPEARTVIW